MRAILASVVLSACCLSSRVHAQDTPVHAQETHDTIATPAFDAAAVVLVGAAYASPTSAELQRVVGELLEREGVVPTFQRAEHFDPQSLLAEPDGDTRVRVFITLPSRDLARLYIRGPHGQRFLLRELTLRNGLDELGRESIAHVIATSTHALLHSTAGIDRAAVRADLSRQGVVEPTVATVATVATDTSSRDQATHASSRPTSIGVELGLRDVVGWSGKALGPRWGAGLELGVRESFSDALSFRQRLVFEHSAQQSLDLPELLAFVGASAVRIGQDVALSAGVHRASIGVAAGVDVLRLTPKRARDRSWALAKPYTEILPMLRGELRYDLALSSVFAALSVFVDVTLSELRLQVRDGAQLRNVAHVPQVMPGIALSLGWRSD